MIRQVAVRSTAWSDASGNDHTLLLGRSCLVGVGRLALRRHCTGKLLPRRLSGARADRERRKGSKTPRHCPAKRGCDSLAKQVRACDHAPVGAARVGNANMPGVAAPHNLRSPALRHRTEILDMKLAVIAETRGRVASHLFPAFWTRSFDFGWTFHRCALRHRKRIGKSLCITFDISNKSNNDECNQEARPPPNGDQNAGSKNGDSWNPGWVRDVRVHIRE
jgi:hypothetical protein